MGAPTRKSRAIRTYLRRLGNPYAKLQIEFVEAAENSPRKLPLAATQDPYATEQSRAARGPRLDCSKSQFENTCRRIFVLYVPEAERPKLRAHHRDFIRRNSARHARERAVICAELLKYDLSDLNGLDPIFNREDDPFTERKLQLLEQKIFGKK
jgi:hypothetical protein